MVNEEMVGGLKSALDRGYSLEKAMLTLFNSGYKRQEIEEAARNLLEYKPELQFQSITKTVPKSAEIKPAPQILTATTPIRTKTVRELQSALNREHSLKKALLSLFNSGYRLEEIEDALRDLFEYKPGVPFQPSIKIVPKGTEIKPSLAMLKPSLAMPRPMPSPIQKIFQLQKPAEAQRPAQKVSVYEQPKIKKISDGKGVIILLFSLLVFLVGMLGAILIFRQQMIDFLNNLFGYS